MRVKNLKRLSGYVAGTAALALVLGACGDSGGGDLGGGGGGGTTNGGGTGGEVTAECEAFADFGSFDGETVTVFSSIREVEADALQEIFDEFGDCVNLTIEHNGSGEFESQIRVQAEGNNAPNLAIFPQPGLLGNMVNEGYVKPAGDSVVAQAQDGWSQDWLNYGTVDGTFYAPPLMASVKSFVWYSPSQFAERGYEVPTTWDELIALSDQIIADTPADQTDTKPWCAGIGSDGATGWPATDWLEDLVLREAGGDVYDQWVSHEIAFDDPQIVAAANKVGDILRNDDYVNGGLGDARSVAATRFQDGGLPILEGKCSMHRMSSFYEAQWPEGTDVSPDGDVFAFYLPGNSVDDQPLLVAGEFVGAFDEEPATQAVHAFMASEIWAQKRIALGGVTTARAGVDPASASSDVLTLAMELLQDQERTTRFDASDLMPSEVGAGSFWTGMTKWLDGGADIETVLAEIEASWPN